MVTAFVLGIAVLYAVDSDHHYQQLPQYISLGSYHPSFRNSFSGYATEHNHDFCASLNWTCSIQGECGSIVKIFGRLKGAHTVVLLDTRNELDARNDGLQVSACPDINSTTELKSQEPLLAPYAFHEVLSELSPTLFDEVRPLLFSASAITQRIQPTPNGKMPAWEWHITFPRFPDVRPFLLLISIIRISISTAEQLFIVVPKAHVGKRCVMGWFLIHLRLTNYIYFYWFAYLVRSFKSAIES